MAVDLTLYLLEKSVTDVRQVVHPSKIGPGGFNEISMVSQFVEPSVPCVAYAKASPPHSPNWADWVGTLFDFGSNAPLSQSGGAVVVLRTQGRVFAAAFGSGWHAVPEDRVEKEFGLIVALNELKPAAIRGLVTKTIDARTRERSTYKHSGGGVPDFGVDLAVEWLRSAAGKTGNPLCSTIRGADALNLKGWQGNIDELPKACKDFLKNFKKGIPEDYGFARNLRPIPKTDPIHHQLEVKLLQMMKARDFSDLSVTLDASDADRAANRLITYKGTEYPLEDMTDSLVKGCLDNLYADYPAFDPDLIQLVIKDSEGNIVLHRHLKSQLHAEISLNNQVYCRVDGGWFRLNDDYIAGINQRLKLKLPDMASSLSIPPWNKTSYPREEHYIRYAAKEKRWLVQDQVNITVAGNPVEPCDLLTPDRHYVCVKNGDSSANLSHLFAQASGSADFLARHAPYSNEMKTRYTAKWPRRKYDLQPTPTFVFGIARDVGQDLFGKMILSKINALEHARRITDLGFQVGVCKIDLI